MTSQNRQEKFLPKVDMQAICNNISLDENGDTRFVQKGKLLSMLLSQQKNRKEKRSTICQKTGTNDIIIRKSWFPISPFIHKNKIHTCAEKKKKKKATEFSQNKRFLINRINRLQSPSSASDAKTSE